MFILLKYLNKNKYFLINQNVIINYFVKDFSKNKEKYIQIF